MTGYLMSFSFDLADHCRVGFGYLTNCEEGSMDFVRV
jgi:hypothetical protein